MSSYWPDETLDIDNYKAAIGLLGYYKIKDENAHLEIEREEPKYGNPKLKLTLITSHAFDKQTTEKIFLEFPESLISWMRDREYNSNFAFRVHLRRATVKK